MRTSRWREEIDRSSMFEEIVGASPRAASSAFPRVSKGSRPRIPLFYSPVKRAQGKELIAPRDPQKISAVLAAAFVSVSCARDSLFVDCIGVVRS